MSICLLDPALELSTSEIFQEEEELSNYDESLNITSYGIGCGIHDAAIDSCVGGHQCGFGVSVSGTWCDYKFCYVESKNYDLQYESSYVFITDTLRYYLYVACGYIDTYSFDPVSIEGET